MKLKYKEEIL